MAQKWKDLTYKDRLSYILCACAFGLSAVLLVAGMLIPPQGEVHASVITSVGMLLTFVGSIIGINQHYNVQLDKIKKEINNKTQWQQ